MLSPTYFELTPQMSDSQVVSGSYNNGKASLQQPSYPPDTHTPISEQFDDITYPGSEVTVIHRVTGQALQNYWCQDPSSAFLLHHETGSGRFGNESSSTTLSCADSYKAQQNARENSVGVCENVLKLPKPDADEGITICAASQCSLSASLGDKNCRNRRRRLSDGENRRYVLEHNRKQSRISSTVCLSEGEVDDGEKCRKHRRSHLRSEDHHRSTRTRSPSCDCNYSHRSTWIHAFDHGLANSLPSMKKQCYHESNSSPNLRRRKPITGMFGANLTASLEEEQWSDSEQIRTHTISTNYCGLLGLSFICLSALGCFISPLFMLLLPLIFSLDKIGSNNLVYPSSLTLTCTCDVRCEADLLSIAVKMLLLCLTTWKLYLQPIVSFWRRLRSHPLSASALLNRKFRSIDYISLDLTPLSPATLYPFPSIERLIGFALSVNFMGVGATCAFWVAFVARWMRWLIWPRPQHLSAVSEDLRVQFGLPALVKPSPDSADQVDPTMPPYATLVSFVLTFTDTLLLLHLVGVMLRTWNFIKDGGRRYVVQVVRSPDGISKTYRVTGTTLEVVATQIIQKYNVDFPLYDSQVASAPYRYIRISPDSPTNKASRDYSRRASLRLRQKLASFSCLTKEEQEYQMKRCSSTGGGSSFKFYSLDGPDTCSTAAESTIMINGGSLGECGESGHNVSALCADRHHSMVEFERVMRKRRMRLLVATEKAFAGVRVLSPDDILLPGCNGTIPPRQAAQILFPKIAVPLQKFLRLTRLQHLHPPDAIISRLALCLSYAASPEAFLSTFSSKEPITSIVTSFLKPRQPTDLGSVPTSSIRCCRPTLAQIKLVQSWRLQIHDTEGVPRHSSGMLPKPGTRFHLSRAGVTLFCHIQLEPLLSLRRVEQTLRTGEGTLAP